MARLKKISVGDLRLGMYFHDFDEAWTKHPFWKGRFLLQNIADLRAALGSGISRCWIDLSKGCDVDKEDPGIVEVEEPIVEPVARGKEKALDLEPTSLKAELARAELLCEGARAATLKMFNDARMGVAIDVDECLTVVNDIAASVRRNPQAFISLARLREVDDGTYMHSVAVCALMIALAHTLGLDGELTREAGAAGLLHDIGKAFIPPGILNKPGKLTDSEYEIVKSHSLSGYQFLANGNIVSKAIGDVSLCHHEKIDGSGYPQGIAGHKISLLARMAAVCDVYDALTSTRPYKTGWDPAESISKMASWTGHFDQIIFSAFVKTVGIYPIGALVRMESRRLAVIVDQNRNALTKPVIKIFFCLKTMMSIPVERVDLSLPEIGDRILERESCDKWNFPEMAGLWREY